MREETVLYGVSVLPEAPGRDETIVGLARSPDYTERPQLKSNVVREMEC